MKSIRYIEEAREEFLYKVEYFTEVSLVLGIIAIAPFKRKPGYWRPRIGAASAAPRSEL